MRPRLCCLRILGAAGAVSRLRCRPHRALAQSQAPGVVLAAGTDGTDGPGEDAGAVVDSETLARGAPLDAGDCLSAADAGRFLHDSGDLIRTGPTGTNVMDLVMAWIEDD